MARKERYVALLRGINVGKAKRIAMADLRALVESLGYGEVRTLLNSGNVVFDGARRTPQGVADALERAVAKDLGVTSRVTVLTAESLEVVVAENSLGALAADASRLLVAFPRDPEAARAALAPLATERWEPDVLALGTRAAYLWCKGGILESRLFDTVGRRLGDAVTTRNWATVTKLHALVRIPAA